MVEQEKWRLGWAGLSLLLGRNQFTANQMEGLFFFKLNLDKTAAKYYNYSPGRVIKMRAQDSSFGTIEMKFPTPSLFEGGKLILAS
jgi:hypothetical protein